LITLKPPQWKVFSCDARFRVLVAGRRFGKTFLSLAELCSAAWAKGRVAWYVAPSYRQAKRIAWKPLKAMTQPYWAKPPNESELRIELKSGGTICLRGADRYDSLRGEGLDFLVVDEYASIAPEAWPEVLRPALADRQGRALFIGTPRGHDHFYDLFQAAEGREGWQAFQFATHEGGNVRPEEMELATRELDERTYRQEFGALFEDATEGRAYHAFKREGNVAKTLYNSRLPLFWSLDFNVNPMCSVIGQKDGERLLVLEEISLRDSNTPAACEEFARRIAKWGRPQGLHVYGDASGNGRRTSSSKTDWQIVRDFLRAQGHLATWHVGAANPPVRDRVNWMNAMLCNQAGERRLVIGEGCRELIRDFERVKWDGVGIDKSDQERSHLSDALGYLVSREFGGPKVTFGMTPLI
jgi:hypothetical protein